LRDLVDVGGQDRRRLLLVAEPGDGLQLADGLLGLRHAGGDGVDLDRQLVGVLVADRHLGQRLDLRLDAVELDGHELGVVLGLVVVVEAQLRGRDRVGERAQDAIVALGLGLLLPRDQLVELLADAGAVGGAQEPAQRLLRQQQLQEHPQQAVEGRRAQLGGGAAGIAGVAAHRVGDALHLDAAGPQPQEAVAAVGLERAQHVGQLLPRGAAAAAGDRRRDAALGAAGLRVDRRLEARQRREPGQVGDLAGRDQRQRHVGVARDHRRRRRAAEEQQVPSVREGLLHVPQPAGLLLASH
jgi:hypothetical protein